LDEVVAAKRKEEERVRRETEDGLRAFRERQRRSSVGEEEAGDANEDWGVGRKRKRRDKERGMVKRKVDGEEKGDDGGADSVPDVPDKVEKKSVLVDYGSDSDE
jgi:hypothetical protein